MDANSIPSHDEDVDRDDTRRHDAATWRDGHHVELRVVTELDDLSHGINADQRIDLKQAAGVVGRSLRTIQRWIDEGRVAAYDEHDALGRPVRLVSQRELARYVWGDDGPPRDGPPSHDDSTQQDTSLLTAVERLTLTLADTTARLDAALRDVTEATVRAVVAERQVVEVSAELVACKMNLHRANDDAVASKAEARKFRRATELAAGRLQAMTRELESAHADVKRLQDNGHTHLRRWRWWRDRR